MEGGGDGGDGGSYRYSYIRCDDYDDNSMITHTHLRDEVFPAGPAADRLNSESAERTMRLAPQSVRPGGGGQQEDETGGAHCFLFGYI